jgi:hypothetical protein
LMIFLRPFGVGSGAGAGGCCNLSSMASSRSVMAAYWSEAVSDGPV